MNEKRNRNRRFEAGVSLIIVAALLISGISMVSGADLVKDSSPSLSKTGNEDMNPLSKPLVPHPIYGTATWEGGGNADGASVAVTSSLGTLSTTVSSGAWQVDCGDPGPNWPSGTSFTVTITGSGSHAGWSGSTSGSVSGFFNNMGAVVVNNDAPSNPSTPSGDTSREIGQIGNYTTSATDSGEQVQIMFDWDASGSHSYSSWSSLVNSGQSVTMPHSWGSAGTYVVKAKARDQYGKESPGWSSGLTVVVSPPNHAPGIPITPSGKTPLVVGESATYSTSATDSDNDQVQYMFDWDASGSHSYSSWTSLVPSGQSSSMPHSWGSAGTYVVKAKARDEHGLESTDWSGGLTVIVTVNNPPGTPSTPTGEPIRQAGQSGTYSTSASDPDGHQVQYMFDWDASGSHDYSGWTSLVSSGQSGSMSHSWGSAGTYVVKAKARDQYGLESLAWSSGFTVTVTMNLPPTVPTTPTGDKSPEAGQSGDYCTSATDPDGDQVQYMFDWDASGSHSYSPWTSLAASGQPKCVAHSWSSAGTYVVKAKARDEHGLESGWSGGFTVTVTPPTGNNDPYTPVILTGPTTGVTGVSYTFSTSTTDPDNDMVSYGWDWDGDGIVNIDDWTGLYPDDTTVQTSHIWDAAGAYNVTVKAKDSRGGMSGFSPAHTVEIRIDNPPEKPDKPSGTEKGDTNKEYTYTTKTTDADGDQVYYNWSWGDGTFSGWLGPFDSGVTRDTPHKWTVDGDYSIKVKAKDVYNAESPWSDPFTITMPFSLNKPMLQFLELLFERFPHAFPILRQLLGY